MVSSYYERSSHKSAVLSKTLNTILEQQRGFPNKRENHEGEQHWFVCFAVPWTYGKYDKVFKERSLDIVPREKKENHHMKFSMHYMA